MSIEYLDPDTTLFIRTEGGFTGLKTDRRKKYKRVNFYRIFPLGRPNEFISVRDEKNREIGIIESLNSFSAEMVQLINEELDRRYFSPAIQRLLSLKEEFGYTYWDAETSAGTCKFTVKGGDGNIFHISDNTLMIIDVDGNRFMFPDFEKTESKYLKIIDVML